MKKIILLVILLFSALTVVACNDEPTNEPTNGPVTFQLLSPYVTLSENGVASWEAVPNAVGYSYVINNNAAINTVNTSVTLSAGDSFKVMAIGDGVTFTNSEYSNIVTYSTEEPTENPTEDEIIDVNKIVLNSVEVSYDGEEHSIYVSNLPSNYTAIYTGNGVIELGTHTVTAKVYDENNNLVKELTATITIVEKYDVELPLV